MQIVLRESMLPNIHPARIVPSSVDAKERADLLRAGCFAAKEYDNAISQVSGTLAGVDHTILVANTEGLYTTDRHVRSRIAIEAVASKGNETQSGS